MASWAGRSADFARDGFALSDGPILPPEVVARARASFDFIVAAADNGEYSGEASMGAPHVQGVVTELLEGGGAFGGLRKVEMPQLDWRVDGITELMNHASLAEHVRSVTGAGWIQAWWIQLHGKPGAGESSTMAQGDGSSIGFHQDKNCE
jgi:hypothetical protein